jgi:methionyl aminopeptidase
MQKAGATVAAVLEAVREAAVPGVTLLQLDDIGARIIADRGCVPSFLGYNGYPKNLCLSPNDVIVHGIPTDDRLEEGDILSVDAGAVFEGFHGDAAFTMPIGAVDPKAQSLIEITERALWAGIGSVHKSAHLGDIGAAVSALGETHGLGIVEEYVGHGIGRQMHEEPQVPNYGTPGRGLKLRTGMALCIEPMFNLGTRHTRVDKDGWTVRTEDGSLSAHFEHTVCVTPDGVQVFTAAQEPVAVEFEQSTTRG